MRHLLNSKNKHVPTATTAIGSPPIIVRHLKHINANESDYVRFDCYLISNPPSQVSS